VLVVFEAVAARQPASLGDLSTASGLPSSTVHRALGVLASSGWVRSVGPGRPRWVVAERIRVLVAGPAVDLAARARPLLAELAATAGETAALWLADGDTVVAAAVAAPSAALRVVLADGTQVPAHACAPGKVVLAARSDLDVRLGAARGLEPVTMRTVGDAEQLLVELRRVRAAGFAVARGEEADGVTSLAAAHGTGDRAAVGVLGPSDRVEARLDELAAMVQGVARRLTRQEDATDK
jgi:IclR family acetate operon transcriptional repressor